MKRFLCALSILALMASLTGCTEEPIDGPPPVLVVAGTGSAGGNPLFFSFEHTDDDAYPTLRWRAPTLAISGLRLAHRSSDGACDLDDIVEVELETRLTFSRDTLIRFEREDPCSIELRPPSDGSPLFEATATIDDGNSTHDLRLSFLLSEGLILELDPDPFTVSPRVVVVLIDVDILLTGVDYEGEPTTEGFVEFIDESSDAVRTLLRSNLLAATQVYLDPDPSDGALLPTEQVPANVIGRFSTP